MSNLAFRSPAAERNKEAILGPAAVERDVSIMVTMPTEAGTDTGLVSDMLVAGMNVARINCARDDADTWEAIDNGI